MRLRSAGGVVDRSISKAQRSAKAVTGAGRVAGTERYGDRAGRRDAPFESSPLTNRSATRTASDDRETLAVLSAGHLFTGAVALWTCRPLITRAKAPCVRWGVFPHVDWRRSIWLKQRSAFAEALHDGRLPVAHPDMRRCRLCDGRFGPLKVERRIAERTLHLEDRHPHQVVPLPAGRSVRSQTGPRLRGPSSGPVSPTGRGLPLLGWGSPRRFLEVSACNSAPCLTGRSRRESADRRSVGRFRWRARY